MSSSSSGPVVDNLSEVLHNYKFTNCKFCIGYVLTKDNQLIFKCKCIECSKNHKKHFNKDSIKRCENTYEFCDRNINKYVMQYIDMQK